ncbi:MAG: hypothetical protein ABH854_02945 [Candidatus Diapherotrites archaeon]
MPLKTKNNGSLLQQFASFVRKPNYDVAGEKGGVRVKIWALFRLWSLTMVVSMVLALVIFVALSVTGLDMGEHMITELIEEQPLYVFIFMAFIWAPIVEELTFRAGMKYSRRAYACSAGLMLTMAVFLLFDIIGIGAGLLTYVIMAVLFATLIWVPLRALVKEGALEQFYRKRFGRIFYFFTGSFAIVHLFNYVDFREIWFIAPLLIAPQFFAGIYLGFARMKYGLKWAMFGHLMHNAALIIPASAMLSLSKSTMDLLNEGGINAVAEVPAADMMLISISMLLFLLVQFVAAIGFVALWLEFNIARKNTGKRA